MGSVLAASSPNPPPASGGGSAPGGAGLVTVPPGFTMPPVSAVPPSSGTLGQPGTDAEASRPNPGTFEECHRKCKGLSKAHLLTLLMWSHNLCSVYFCLLFCMFLFSFRLHLRGLPYADGGGTPCCQQGLE